jgi:hypothetical protein
LINKKTFNTRDLVPAVKSAKVFDILDGILWIFFHNCF